jgi:DNA-binding SARP family transcriptional activator
MGWEDKDRLLIMGGYGSPSGKQEESPRSFYDLYRINVRDGKCTKVWNMDTHKNHFVFGNSLVVDKEANRVYALTYDNSRFNTHIYLSRFDLKTTAPVQCVMSDSIEYNFFDLHSYCDLFFDKETSSLYAIVQQDKGNATAIINIYQLIFPLFSQEELLPSNANEGLQSWIKYGIIFFLLTLTAGLVLTGIIKRRKSGNNDVQPANLTEEGRFLSVKNIHKKPSSMISSLGEFQVFDKEGNDITSDFTPTLKLLFLYILLFSIKNGRGITSQHLDDTFWFDMEKSKASNNRNVNIRKLRLILEKIGNIKLLNKGSYWFLEIGEDIVCDYKEVTDILLRLKSKKESITKDNITQIIDFAATGALLSNIDAEWADEYKVEYSTLIIEIMLQAINHPEIKRDDRLLLEATNVILISDTIDEDAVRIKCKVLFRTGQKGLSKQCFDKFCSEYKRLLNTEPDLKYEDIIA